MALKMTLKSLTVLGILLMAAQVSAEETQVLKTQKDKESYSLGVEMGRNLKRQGIEADPAIVARGVKDAMTSDKLLLTDEELLATMNIFATGLRAKQAKARMIAAEDNKKAGEAFLAANKATGGVVTLPSGLQYKILKMGDGKKPTEADTVECNYRGTLINGTEFESTYRAGEPALIQVSDPRIVAGFRQALKLMPVGSMWQLFIPSNLAYGQRGAGRYIGPNATVIFEVELLAIK